MSTGLRRHGAVPLCGALLLAVAAPLAACSSGSTPATAAAGGSSTVISPSSTPSSAAGAAGASSGSVTGSPTPSAGGRTSSPASATAAPSSPHPAATTARPVTAGAANGRLVPSCRPPEFAQHAGFARGGVQTYLLAPYASGAMGGTGTAAALALLHGGQAVRFSTQQLVAARGLLATCPRPVAGVVQAVDDQVAALRDLWPAFAANRVPSAAAVARVRAAQAATTAAAASARMPLPALVPTAVQIQAG